MLNYTMSDKATAALAELTGAVKTCEELRIAGKAYAGKDEQLDVCKSKAKELNKIIASDIVAAYAEMAKTDAVGVVRDYFDSWFFTGYAVKQHDAENGGDIYTAETNVRIPFSAIDAASKQKLTQNGAWRKYLIIFADNCVRYNCSNEKGEDGKTETAIYAKQGLPADLLKLRKEKAGWDVCTKSGLAKQFNELVAMILPESMATKMLKADCRSFIAAMLDLRRSDSMENAGIEFSMANARKLEEILFRHIRARRLNLATKYDMGYKQDANPATPGMGEKPADGGPISGGDPNAETGSKETSKENAAA